MVLRLCELSNAHSAPPVVYLIPDFTVVSQPICNRFHGILSRRIGPMVSQTPEKLITWTISAFIDHLLPENVGTATFWFYYSNLIFRTWNQSLLSTRLSSAGNPESWGTDPHGNELHNLFSEVVSKGEGGTPWKLWQRTRSRESIYWKESSPCLRGSAACHFFDHEKFATNRPRARGRARAVWHEVAAPSCFWWRHWAKEASGRRAFKGRSVLLYPGRKKKEKERKWNDYYYK